MTTAPGRPRPAASVVLLRPTPGSAEPFEAYLIRRHRGMKFLGGFYAFPGGKVDPVDAASGSLTACLGLDPAGAAALLDSEDLPALAYWVTGVRELLEETGVLVAADGAGQPVNAGDAAVAARIEELRRALMAGEAMLGDLLGSEGWRLDLRPLRYLCHFITPRASPIRFTARFFLCPLPAGQAPRLFAEETSEGFWMGPAEAHRRFRAGEMAMAEPAEYGLGYLAQFGSLDEVWAAHGDGRHKFHGIVDRIDGFWKGFDWTTARWSAGPA